MPILFRCENCRQKLSVPVRKAGQTVNCPKCEQPIQIPLPVAKLADDEPEAETVFEPEPEPEPEKTPERKKSPLPPTREMPASEKAELDEEDKAWAQTRELPEKSPSKRDVSPIPPSAAPTLAATTEKIPFPSQTQPAVAAKPPEEEEFELRRSRTELEEMDLTPMVDVTFLLLIFFMITASFSLTKTIETPAPDPDKKGAQTLQNLEELEKTSITVRIDEQDNITIQDHDRYDTTPVEPADLELVLGDMLRAEQKNELIIQVSLQCLHEAFDTVFVAGTGAGMQKIRLAAVISEE